MPTSNGISQPILLVLFFTLCIFSCTESESPKPKEPPVDPIADFLKIDLDKLPNYSNPAFPPHFRTPQVSGSDNSPSHNPVTDIGASLGRVLFYDKQISINNSTSCASCHDQKTGFTDVAVFSQGFEGGLTGAHSMRLANANYYTGARMFWDKRAESLEDQATQPIKDALEMGFDQSVGGMDSLIRKLKTRPYYPILFERAFGSDTITEAGIQSALAQFIRSMLSYHSKFDQGYAMVFTSEPGNGMREDFPNFTDQENLGKQLFLGNSPAEGRMGGSSCNTCHQAPTFALSNNSKSNGLDAGEEKVFKSPSLKNIAIVGNYMHDGRFGSLEQVIDHYASGIQTGPALDQRLTRPGNLALQVDFTPEEKAALVAFLKTLTDDVILADEKYSDPFK